MSDLSDATLDATLSLLSVMLRRLIVSRTHDEYDDELYALLSALADDALYRAVNANDADSAAWLAVSKRIRGWSDELC